MLKSSNTFPGVFSKPDTVGPCSSPCYGPAPRLPSSLQPALAAAPARVGQVPSNRPGLQSLCCGQRALLTPTSGPGLPTSVSVCSCSSLLASLNAAFLLPRPWVLARPSLIFVGLLVLCHIQSPPPCHPDLGGRAGAACSQFLPKSPGIS